MHRFLSASLYRWETYHRARQRPKHIYFSNVAVRVFQITLSWPALFAVGWLGMTWLYAAEIIPLRIRAPANELSTSVNCAFNFMVVMITPVSFSSIGYKTDIIFAVINAFICSVMYFFYPETAYRSLEERDVIFRKTKNIFTVASTAKDEPHMYGKSGEVRWPGPHHS